MPASRSLLDQPFLQLLGEHTSVWTSELEFKQSSPYSQSLNSACPSSTVLQVLLFVGTSEGDTEFLTGLVSLSVHQGLTSLTQPHVVQPLP